MDLTKLELNKNFAFLTLTMKEAHDIMLKEGLTFNHEKLYVSITRDWGTKNPNSRLAQLLFLIPFHNINLKYHYMGHKVSIWCKQHNWNKL